MFLFYSLSFFLFFWSHNCMSNRWLYYQQLQLYVPAGTRILGDNYHLSPRPVSSQDTLFQIIDINLIKILGVRHLLWRQFGWNCRVHHTLKSLSPRILDGRPRLMQKLKLLYVSLDTRQPGTYTVHVRPVGIIHLSSVPHGCDRLAPMKYFRRLCSWGLCRWAKARMMIDFLPACVATATQAEWYHF
jgi:hypothetical protein